MPGNYISTCFPITRPISKTLLTHDLGTPAVVGVGLAFMLVLLLGVIFTIPAHGLSVPVLELVSLAVLVIIGMVASALVSARRLATLKVVEALREL